MMAPMNLITLIAELQTIRDTVDRLLKDLGPAPSPDPIKLPEVQSSARDLIKTKGKDSLLAILSPHGLKNLSSADPTLYPVLLKEINEAIARKA